MNKFSWLKSDCNVDSLMPTLGIALFVSLGKTLNVVLLTGIYTLCGVEEKQKCLFYNDIYQKIKKEQADMVLLLSLKVGLGENCPMLNICYIVPKARRINTYK